MKPVFHLGTSGELCVSTSTLEIPPEKAVKYSQHPPFQNRFNSRVVGSFWAKCMLFDVACVALCIRNTSEWLKILVVSLEKIWYI